MTKTTDPGLWFAVVCLWCGEVYEKPLARSATLGDPGCPVCGYVGWAEAAPKLAAAAS